MSIFSKTNRFLDQVKYESVFVLLSFFLRLDIAMDNSEYHSFGDKVSNELKAYDEVRFASIEERKDTGVLSSETIRSLCHGNNGKDLLILSYC